MAVFSRVRDRHDTKWIGPMGYLDGGVLTVRSDLPYTRFTFHHHIQDVKGPRRPLNPVASSKLTVEVQPSTRKYRVYPSTTLYEPHSSYLPWMNGTITYSHFLSPLPYFGPEQAVTYTPYADAVNAAFVSFATQIPEVTSIANFLYELREIKELIPKIERNLVRTVSGAYLALEFGWKPFISDIRKLGSLVTTVQKRLDFLRSTYGVPTTIRYTKDLSSSRSSGYLWNRVLLAGTPGTVSEISYHLILKEFNEVFRAQGVLTQRLVGLDDSLGVLRAFSAALGLNNPTLVVWNALPYSFIVDWFANVGKLLDRIASQPFEGEWNVTDVVSSIKSHYVFGVDQHFCIGHSDNVHYADIGRVTLDAYSRVIGLPATPLISLGTLDTRQQTLLAALIAQKTLH